MSGFVTAGTAREGTDNTSGLLERIAPATYTTCPPTQPFFAQWHTDAVEGMNATAAGAIDVAGTGGAVVGAAADRSRPRRTVRKIVGRSAVEVDFVLSGHNVASTGDITDESRIVADRIPACRQHRACKAVPLP